MGSAASSPEVSSGRSALQELAGKKGLHCPTLASIYHPTTNERWTLIVFAPMGFFGLIFAARNMTTKALLAKEFTDAELGKEKERQRIVMSWNVIFKAIATDLAASNINNGEAGPLPWCFTGSGTLAIAVKLQLQGALLPRQKAPDMFRCELTPVEVSQQNVFRYFIDPLAVFACKKRTDPVDRPDPVKERQYGTSEATAIVKATVANTAQAAITQHHSRIEKLKYDVRQLRMEGRMAVGQATAQALLLRCVAMPTANAASVLAIHTMLPDEYQDPLLCDVPRSPPAAPQTRPFPPALFPASVTGHGDLPAAERSAGVAARAEQSSPASVAYYTLHRFIAPADVDRLGLRDDGLFQLLVAMEHGITDHPWCSRHRVAVLLRLLLHHLSQPTGSDASACALGLSLPADAVAALVLAVMCMGLHRPRLTDTGSAAESEHYLSSLYPQHPLANHSVAVMHALAYKHQLASRGCCARGCFIRALLPVLVQLVSLVDTADADVTNKGLKDIFLTLLSAPE